jgi:hypothetical protein
LKKILLLIKSLLITCKNGGEKCQNQKETGTEPVFPLKAGTGAFSLKWPELLV